MTEEEWLKCDDAGSMLEFLGGRLRVAPRGARESFTRSLHRFYLASCRAIWSLLPHESSRHGVELAERFLAGQVTAEQVMEYNWYAEGAAFFFDYTKADEIECMDEIARYVSEVKSLPVQEFRAMFHPPTMADEIEPRELLKQAAYFADYAMIYSSLRGHRPPPKSYRKFLSAEVLRQHIAYPGPVVE